MKTFIRALMMAVVAFSWNVQAGGLWKKALKKSKTKSKESKSKSKEGSLNTFLNYEYTQQIRRVPYKSKSMKSD